MQVSTVPFLDLHLHQERSARLNQVLADRGVEPRADWSAWRSDLAGSVPPGMDRLRALWASAPTPYEADLPEVTEARLRALLRESAAAGAVLAELRVGNETVIRPDFLDHFQRAETAVRVEYPGFHASLVVTMKLWSSPRMLQQAVSLCTQPGGVGIMGVDLLYQPYDTEADLTAARPLTDQVAAAGLGLTAHGGEFSADNISALLRLPGLSRIGHAIHAVDDPRLLDELLAADVAVECCLSSNLILGAVSTLASHPIGRLREAGVPLVLGTDNPLHFGTSIDREYALAASLGFGPDHLLEISRTAVERAFVHPAVRRELRSMPGMTVASR